MARAFLGFLDVIQNLLNNVENFIPHRDKDVFISSLLCMPPASLVQPQDLAAHGYELDTYYWIYTMPVSARTCLWALVPP